MSEGMLLNVDRFAVCSTGEEIEIPEPANSLEAAIKLRDEKQAGDDDETWEIIAVLAAASEPSASVSAMHNDDLAVDDFAQKMKEKLSYKRVEGYEGWEDECTSEFLSSQLRSHVDKGDPIDVANFAMMLEQRGERISATPYRMRERFADILKIQFNEAMRDTSDSYMVGLYNGMEMMCCNVDKTVYRPIKATKKEPTSVGMEPVAKAVYFDSFSCEIRPCDGHVPTVGMIYHSSEQLTTLQAKLDGATHAIADLHASLLKVEAKLEQAEKDKAELVIENKELREIANKEPHH